MPESKDQGTNFEFTVVQKLNQGTNPGKGCNLSWVSFLPTAGRFCFFFGQAKKKK